MQDLADVVKSTATETSAVLRSVLVRRLGISDEDALDGNLMAASRDTRYQETAQAVAAYFLGIRLGEEGMILISDQDAWVEVEDVHINEADEDWCIRRAAVRLAGPLAMCQLRKEEVDWKTQRFSPHYHRDIQDGLNLFRRYWRRVGRFGSDANIDAQMNRAASIARECLHNNEAAIAAVLDASEGRDQFSRGEIYTMIQTVQQ
jgi:hypothetical protein